MSAWLTLVIAQLKSDLSIPFDIIHSWTSCPAFLLIVSKLQLRRPLSQSPNLNRSHISFDIGDWTSLNHPQKPQKLRPWLGYYSRLHAEKPASKLSLSPFFLIQLNSPSRHLRLETSFHNSSNPKTHQKLLPPYILSS